MEVIQSNVHPVFLWTSFRYHVTSCYQNILSKHRINMILTQNYFTAVKSRVNFLQLLNWSDCFSCSFDHFRLSPYYDLMELHLNDSLNRYWNKLKGNCPFVCGNLFFWSHEVSVNIWQKGNILNVKYHHDE